MPFSSTAASARSFRLRRVPPIAPRLAAAAALIAAVVNAGLWLASSPVPVARHLGSRIAQSPASSLTVGPQLSGLAAVAMALLAVGLLRRRRIAWALACAGLLAAVAVGAVHHESGRELAPLAGAGAALAASRRRLVAEPYAPVLEAWGPTSVDEVAAIVARHGDDTLAPFKVRDDVAHLVSADGDAVLAYRVEAGALLVSGDPVGTTAGCRQVLRQARALAERCGLRFGVAAASEPLAEQLRDEFGLQTLYMGCEAIVDPSSFSLSGHRIKKVRQAHARVLRSGLTLDAVALDALTPEDLAAIEDCQQRSRVEAEEQSFAMAPDHLGSAKRAGGLVVRARTPDGRVMGALIVLPVPRIASWTLALQARDPDGPNGVIDALIVHTLLMAHEWNVRRVSLNFAAARRYVHEPVHGLWPHVARRLANLAMRWTQIDTLRAHNEKFSPQWQPRYLAADHPLQVPRMAFATIWQEGQLPRPSAVLPPAWPRNA